MDTFEGVKFVYAASETCEHSCVSADEDDKKPVYKIRRRLRGFGRDWDAVFVVLFFEQNPGYKPFPWSSPVGAHPKDVERLVVLLDGDGFPDRVYFGAHGRGQGQWRAWSECDTAGGLLTAYVSPQSHALSHKTGTHVRILGFANDTFRKDGRSCTAFVESMVDASAQKWSVGPEQLAPGVNSPAFVVDPDVHSVTAAERIGLAFPAVRERLAAYPKLESIPA